MVNVVIKKHVVVGGVIYVGWANGRPYAGQSRVLDENRFPTKRRNRHLKDAESGDPLPFHRAIAKYGLEKFEVLEFIPIDNADDDIGEVLNEIDDENDAFTFEFLDESPLKRLIAALNAAECVWIEKLNSMTPEKGGRGWNCAPGGGAFDHPPHTEEHKQWMSKRMTGRKLAQETKDKLSAFRSGRPLTIAHRAAIKQTANDKFWSTFPERIDEWRKQYARLGRLPNASNSDLEEKSAACWRSTILKKKDADELPEEFEHVLNTIPEWVWKCPRGRKVGSKNKVKQG
jgi:hypothetical protein